MKPHIMTCLYVGKTGLYVLLAGSLLLSVPVQADVYKSIDKHGRVIYTDRPLNTNSKRLVKTWKGWAEQPKAKLNVAAFSQNRKKFTPTVDYAAKRYNLNKHLLHAVITAESAYDPSAVSRAGAVGLMQLMPETAKRYGVKDRKNPYQNIHGGSQYLRDLMKLFKNDLSLVLAAYNAGEGAVKKYGNKIPPYPETRNYVRKVKEYYAQYSKTSG